MVNSYAQKKSVANELTSLKKKFIKLYEDNKSHLGLVERFEYEKKLYKNYNRKTVQKAIDDLQDLIDSKMPKKKVKKQKEEKKEYSCKAVFYRLMKEDEEEKKGKKDKYLTRNGKRYVQTWAVLANVKGNIPLFNNTLTFRPNKDEMTLLEFNEAQRVWTKLIKILKTDPEIMVFLELAGQNSFDFHLIVITKVAERGKGDANFDFLEGKLFSETAPQAIYSKDISYKLNEQATNFSELFGITLNKYTQENYKANSCYLNLLVDTWHEEFNKIKSDGKRMYAELTYESICELINLTYKTQDIGISIRESLPFFEKYRLGIDVLNVFGQFAFQFRPERGLNQNLFPQVLRVLIHNNHLYKLDKACKSKLDKLRKQFVEKEISDEKLDEVHTLQVSNKYKLRKPVLDGSEVHFINDLDACVKKVIDSKVEKIKFVTNTDLVDVLFQMRDNDYTPYICFGGLNLQSLSFKVGKVFASIENTDPTCPEDTIVQLDSKEAYEEYHKANDEFYFKIFQENLKSCYPDAVLEIENKYPMGPLSGYFTKRPSPNDLFNAVDTVKAYSHCLSKIQTVPVFGYFDEYKDYDDHFIEAFTMYLVEVHTNGNIAHSILFPTVFSRCYGFKLFRAQKEGIQFKIHAFRRPCNLEQVNYEDPVNDVYKNEKLTTQNKKDIVNRTTGLLEKKYNSAHVTKIFDNFAEAQHYQLKYDGKIYTLQQSFHGLEKSTEREDPLNFGLDMKEFDSSDHTKTTLTYGKKIHLLILEKKEQLVEGYRYIKELIYEKMSMKMFDLYNEVVSKGITPKGIKTDAILVSRSESELKKLFAFNKDEIGGIKFDCGKLCNDRKIEQAVNEPFQVKKTIVNEIQIKDEWDSEEFKKVFDLNSRILIKGTLPGVGKTTSVTNYKNHKILIVPPYNKLAQQLRIEGHNSVTLNMLLGFYGDGQDYKTWNGYNTDEFDCICYDEIMINPPKVLKKIDLFMKKHPEKKYLATGDVDQLQPIDFNPNNVKNKQMYLMECINQMFQHQITLKINKRLKTQSQREKLYQLKVDVFDLKKDVLTTLKNYGFKIINKFSEIDTLHNICYFNFRTDQVNEYVHKKLVQKSEGAIKIKGVNYWVGLELTCKQHYKEKGRKLFKNTTYNIMAINDKQFTIKAVVENTTFTFPISKLSYFSLPYANTCHSVQGISIDDKMTIFDVNTPYVDRYFVWTALTRARDLENVKIFQHSKEETQELHRRKVLQYLTKKVEDYKKQDKVAKREFVKEDYIDADWINDEYFKLKQAGCTCCSCCKTPYYIFPDPNGEVISNLTVDRIDSSKSHIKSNSRLLCIDCNRTKGNRY